LFHFVGFESGIDAIGCIDGPFWEFCLLMY
jgi:hypothetical protein